MKKCITLALFCALGFAACKKSHGPSVSHWTLGSQSFTASSTLFMVSSSGYLLRAADTMATPQGTLEIIFAVMPVSSQDYQVVNAFTGHIDSAHCAIGFLTGPIASPSIGAISTGGGTLHVSISSDNKVTASFNSINMTIGNNSYSSLSGVLIQQ